MTETEAQRAQLAASAKPEDIPLYVHDPSSLVISSLLENRNLTEEHLLIIANRKNVPPDILTSIFKDKRWSESYAVRLALARNPKTPLFTALSIARYLRLFDLADMARNHALPVVFRKKVETIVIEKIPSLPLGIKKTLAKVSSGEILLALILDGYPEVVSICLGSPSLIEAHLYKVINRKTTSQGIIRTIAEHRGWTCRYSIKFALIRNPHTPLARSVPFIAEMRIADLVELYRDPLLPPEVKPYLHRELLERGKDPEHLTPPDEERIIEIDDQELDELER